MRARERVTFSSALIFLVAVAASLGSSTAAEYKMSTPTPPGIASPDKVETRFGTLNFFDGFRTPQASRRSTTTSTSSEPCKPTSWRYRL